jgi:hypothetical protein
MVQLDYKTNDRNQLEIGRFEKFIPKVHTSSDEKAGENISQNRETRKAGRSQRATDPETSLPPITEDQIGGMIANEHKDGKISRERAEKFLQKMEEFGITRDQSNKWRNKFLVLEKIVNNQ